MKISFITLNLYLLTIFSAKAQLNGSYTIGGVSPDYIDIVSAQADLSLQGVNGPVTFNIRSGDYSSTVTSFSFGSLFLIVFQSETQNPNDVILDVNAFYSCSNITLNAVTFYPNSNSGAGGFNYKGMNIEAGNNITISNCIIRGKAAINYRNGISIVKAQSHSLINNNFIDLDNAISFSSSTYWGSHRHYGLNIVKGCVFDSCDTGLRVMGEIWDTLDVFENTFINSGIGIYLDGSDDEVDHTLIHQNIMYNINNYGIRIDNNTYSSTFFPIKIYNNMISGGFNGGLSLWNAQGQFYTPNIICLRIRDTRYTECYNNSFYGGVNIEKADYVKFKNNCVSSDTSLLMFVDFQSDFLESDYNSFHRSNDSVKVVYNSSWYWELDSIKILTGNEQHSVYTNPLYNSNIDLHATHPLIQFAATPISYVTNDIDYESRNVNPDIGADEFNNSNLPPYAYFSHPCSSGSLNIDFSDMTVRPGTYHWDFGDGDTSIVGNPSHSFPSYGIYWVTLKATNLFGTHQWSDSVSVVAPVTIQNNGTDLFISNNFSNYQWYLNGNAIPNETSNIYTPLFNGSYSISYEDSSGCIITTSDLSFIIGIEDIIINEKIRLFPNPNTGQFTIEKPIGLNKEVKVELLDAASKLILEKVIPIGKQKVEIDITNYSRGIYYLQLIVEDEVFVKQILKN